MTGPLSRRRAVFGLAALPVGLLAACGGAPAPTAAPAAPSAPSASTAAPATAAPATQKPTSLRVGLIPNQQPDAVKTQYEAFRAYLADRLKLGVELFVATDYAGVVEAMASDRLDVAYFGGVTYVQAEQRAKIYPIVTEVDRDTNTTKYHSVIITQADSPIMTIADLKGKKFAFGDISSTSGSLYPRLMLEKAGITDFKNPELFIYTGGHDATTLAVQHGTVAGGGVEERIMKRLIEAGRVDSAKIRVVERSSPIEGYPWAVREALDKAFVDQVAQAYLDIKDENLLKLMRAVRYERVTAKDYDEVRTEARRLGLLTPAK